jgi:hypothetical protein
MTTTTAPTFTADNGVTFAVRIVRPGEGYGRSRAVTNHTDQALVEMFDARYAGKNGFEAEGQIIAQYNLGSLLNDPDTLTNYGLNMHFGVPAWSIDGDTMGAILFHIERNL